MKQLHFRLFLLHVCAKTRDTAIMLSNNKTEFFVSTNTIKLRGFSYHKNKDF